MKKRLFTMQSNRTKITGLLLVLLMGVLVGCPTEPPKAAEGGGDSGGDPARVPIVIKGIATDWTTVVVGEATNNEVQITKYKGIDKLTMTNIVIPTVVIVEETQTDDDGNDIKVDVEKKVVEIGNNTGIFDQATGIKRNTNIRTIDILNATYLTKINASAFAFMKKAKSITLPAGDNLKTIGNSAFRDNIVLTSITIPASVTTIGDSAFLNNKDLKSVVLPASLETIGVSAFENTGLKSLTIPANGDDSEDYATPTTIGASAFKGNKGLESVVILASTNPAVKTEIGASAFQDNTNLKSITLPESVTTIGASAFENNADLESITLPESIITIGASAFENTGLTSLTIPASVTTLGADVYKDTPDLRSLIILGTAKTKIEKAEFANRVYLTSITIPASVITIEQEAFKKATALTEVIFAEDATLTTIKRLAFQETSISSIILPKTLTTIGPGAFFKATKLTSVTILKSEAPLTTINFDPNANIKEINAFEGTPIADKAIPSTIYYPNGVEGYKTADNWKRYYNTTPADSPSAWEEIPEVVAPEGN